MTFEAVIYRHEFGWSASVPAFDDCEYAAATYEEALCGVREALAAKLGAMSEAEVAEVRRGSVAVVALNFGEFAACGVIYESGGRFGAYAPLLLEISPCDTYLLALSGLQAATRALAPLLTAADIERLKAASPAVVVLQIDAKPRKFMI